MKMCPRIIITPNTNSTKQSLFSVSKYGSVTQFKNTKDIMMRKIAAALQINLIIVLSPYAKQSAMATSKKPTAKNRATILTSVEFTPGSISICGLFGGSLYIRNHYPLPSFVYS